MGKFKVGDRVRAVVDFLPYFKAGDVGTVDENGSSAPWVKWCCDRNWGDGIWAANEDKLELLPVAVAIGKTAAVEPAFKVGDRGLCKHGNPKGEFGTIIALNGDNATICFADWHDGHSGGKADGSKNHWYSTFDELTPSTLTIEAGKYYKTRDGRKIGPMKKWHLGGWVVAEGGGFAGGLWDINGAAWFDNSNDSPALIAEWVDEPAAEPNNNNTPAIVALIENGQPMPALHPLVHDTKDDAEKEAHRLSEKHRGKEFGVFTLISKHQAAAVYEHEWQRLAANGNKIGAIKAIRELTGFGLKASKDGLEDWLSRNAA